jgi:hypothetical protein
MKISLEFSALSVCAETFEAVNRAVSVNVEIRTNWSKVRIGILREDCQKLVHAVLAKGEPEQFS